jgi:ERCC4-related helicase
MCLFLKLIELVVSFSFVMIPEIFFNLIEKKYFELNIISLVVFDECHHCQEKSFV